MVVLFSKPNTSRRTLDERNLANGLSRPRVCKNLLLTVVSCFSISQETSLHEHNNYHNIGMKHYTVHHIK